MHSLDIPEGIDQIDQDRRRFLGTAAMAAAAGQLGLIDPAGAQRQPNSQQHLWGR